MKPSRSKPAALLWALLWALGTVVLPVRHLALHSLPHDHEGGGIHYHLDGAQGHAHGDDDDGHDDDQPGGPPAVEAPHGHRHSHAPHAAGLAHFAAATGDGAERAVELGLTRAPVLAPRPLANREVVFLLEGKKAARAPPAG